ncbi:MAG: Rne/Rng family ribonuclease, partial [Alphaproteobacteria bacterium]|nr:Rne/Rng family ribonuclease [Alphaproteobacteria bacterium]
FEAASKRPLKGNIYLAKVTRVEPSLQAAFVEYGGNRQGFLAFAEIHPDYYQIPMADRQALLAEQEAEARRRQEDEIESFEISAETKAEGSEEEEETEGDIVEEGEAEMAPLVPLDAAEEAEAEAIPESLHPAGEGEHADEAEHEEVFVNHGGAAETADVLDHDEEEEDTVTESETAEAALSDYGSDETVAAAEHAEENEGEMEPVAPVGETTEGETGTAEVIEDGGATGETQPLQSARPSQRWVRKKHYKIQEVIKRRQIILVQVVKEERGNKGAALTTYLSLAGRYCVLMPNTPRGGGISRKITNAADRKRLKSAAQGLELPEGMGLIIRTAGESRTRLEIRRDYEYLMRMWDQIRETTLNSNAPAKVYEEGDLVKRAIRDLYNKDVQDLVVEGEAGYRNAKDFMRMLMPAQARNVHQYRDAVPLFQRMHIESQLDSMFSPTVTLRSGGYIVINQTEALVSIDVNSGRATREHSIEETARKTNLEAAEEIARQLRLRDLAGLIVIDFIDMEDGRNDREVEKRLRDAVKNDRARVQIGKISQFGLLEMSRQRLRAGMVAGSTITCPHCGGVGLVRSVESSALRVLRALEEEGEKSKSAAVAVKVPTEIAIYVLNQKRHELARLESEHRMEITFLPLDSMPAGQFEIDRLKSRDPGERPRAHTVGIEAGFVPPDEPELDYVEESDEEDIAVPADAEMESEEDEADAADGEAGHRNDGEGRGRRRRRRGGRGRNRDRNRDGRPHEGPPRGERDPQEGQPREAIEFAEGEPESENGETTAAASDNGIGQPEQNGDGARRRRRRRRGRRGGRDREDRPQDQAAPQNGREQPAAYAADRFGSTDEIDTTPSDTSVTPNTPSTPAWSLSAEPEIDTTPAEEAPKPVRKGWWQKTFGGGEK